MKRIVVISDMHCGHVCGLTPPSHNHACDEAAGEHEKKAERLRRDLWSWFAKEIEGLRPIYALIVNGDAIDGRGDRSGSTELLTVDREKQCEMAESVIKFIGAPLVNMTYGTAYHTGNQEDWEGLIARHVGAKIEAKGHYEIDGFVIAAKHKIGNTNSPMSRFTPLARVKVLEDLWADRGQQPKPNLIIRSHIHRADIAGSPGDDVRILTTPALQGLGSKYGARECDGMPVDFGFVSIDVNSKDDVAVRFHLAPMTLFKASVTKL